MSSTTRSSIYYRNGEELIRFVKNSTHLIKNILDKTQSRRNRIEKKNKEGKPVKKVMKRRPSKSQFNSQDSCPPSFVDSSVANPYQSFYPPSCPQPNSTSMNAYQEQVPFEYLTQNVYANIYEEEELSVENLLPSLQLCEAFTSTYSSCPTASMPLSSTESWSLVPQTYNYQMMNPSEKEYFQFEKSTCY